MRKIAGPTEMPCRHLCGYDQAWELRMTGKNSVARMLMRRLRVSAGLRLQRQRVALVPGFQETDAAALSFREAFSGARNEEGGVKSVERTDGCNSEEYKNGNQLRNMAFRGKIFKKIVQHKSEKNSKKAERTNEERYTTHFSAFDLSAHSNIFTCRRPA